MAKAALKIVPEASQPRAIIIPFASYGEAPERMKLPPYRSGMACPGCHRSANWHVGRCTAECAHCKTVLPV